MSTMRHDITYTYWSETEIHEFHSALPIIASDAELWAEVNQIRGPREARLGAFNSSIARSPDMRTALVIDWTRE